ncbi:MAG: RNA polymerase sigma factor [Saprospiraceae bacterium]
MQTTEHLISNCQKGDKKSQYLLVKKYSGLLLTVCRRYARDEGMAKDALQETFISIFSNIKKYKATGSFEGWMRRIAVNSSLKPMERKGYSHELATDEFGDTSSQEPEVFFQLREEEIIKHIQSLPEGYRTVLNLYAIEGYSHKEIGEMLNISVSTSRSQLLRARNILRQKVSDIPKKASA